MGWCISVNLVIITYVEVNVVLEQYVWRIGPQASPLPCWRIFLGHGHVYFRKYSSNFVKVNVVLEQYIWGIGPQASPPPLFFWATGLCFSVRVVVIIIIIMMTF